MQTTVFVSTGSGADSWIIRGAFVLFMLACVADQRLFAQELSDGMPACNYVTTSGGPRYAQDENAANDWGGTFWLCFRTGDVEDPQQQIVEAFLKDNRNYFDELLGSLNEKIILAEDIGIYFMSGPNISVYDSKTNEIAISYAHIVAVLRVFERQYEDFWDNTDKATEKIYPNIVETIFHEIGHALIDVNELHPKAETDIEKLEMERLVDQLAFYIMSWIYGCEDESCDAKLWPIAEYYLAQSTKAQLERKGIGELYELFGGFEPDVTEDDISTHPDDGERGFNHVCWMHGKWQFEMLLDTPALENCEYLYYNLASDWHARLTPWSRN